MSHLSRVAPDPAVVGAPCFTIDRSNRCLWRDRTRLDMPPKAFDVLDYLRRNPGRLVSQDEILDHVWCRRFVQPEIVKTYIRTLRRLLDDDVRHPRFIETRPRSGYRFLGGLPDRPAVIAEASACTLEGLEEESAALNVALDRARAGQRDCLVITGDAGSGKSAVLDAFIETARRDVGVLTAIAYGAPARGSPEPLSLAIALLQDLTRQMDPAALAQALVVHAPNWRHCLGPDRDPLPHQPRPDWWPQTMVREACALLEHFGSTNTIVLAFDGVQWADPDTINFLVCLGLRRYSARLLAVATFRQVGSTELCPVREAIDNLVFQSRAREIALSPSPRVEAGLSSPVGCRASFEILHGDAEDEHEGLTRSVGSESPGVRSALEAGSIAGPRFCAWAVASILSKDVAEVEDLLSYLAAANQYLRRDGSYTLPDGKRTPIYKFRDLAGQQAFLNDQPPARRTQRYHLFGQAIISLWGDSVKTVANDVSRCFRYAGNWPGVIVYNRLAAEVAAEQNRPMDAVRLLTEALDLSARLSIDGGPALRRHPASH